MRHRSLTAQIAFQAQSLVLESWNTSTQLRISLLSLGNRLRADKALPFEIAFHSSASNPTTLAGRLNFCTLYPSSHMKAFQRQLLMMGDTPHISVSNRGEWEAVNVFLIAWEHTDITNIDRELRDLQRVM